MQRMSKKLWWAKNFLTNFPTFLAWSWSRHLGLFQASERPKIFWETMEKSQSLYKWRSHLVKILRDLTQMEQILRITLLTWLTQLIFPSDKSWGSVNSFSTNCLTSNDVINKNENSANFRLFPVTRQPPFPATADGNFFERGNKVATLLGFKLSFGSINLQSIKINPNGGSPSNSKVSKNFSLRLKTGKSFTISGRKVRLRFPVSVAKEKKITSVFIIKVQYYVTLIPWNTETGYWNLFCSLTRVISKVTLLASAAEAGFQEGSFSLFRHI